MMAYLVLGGAIRTQEARKGSFVMKYVVSRSWHSASVACRMLHVAWHALALGLRALDGVEDSGTRARPDEAARGDLSGQHIIIL